MALMNFHSLKFRITAALLVVICLVLLLEVKYLGPRISDNVLNEARLVQIELATQISSSIDYTLWQAMEELEAFANLPDIESMDRKRLDEAILEVNKLTQFFNYYFVLDRSGRWVSYPTRPEMVGSSIPEQNMGWVRETFAMNWTVSLDVVVTEMGTMVSGFSTPINDIGGETMGLLRGVIVVSDDNNMFSSIKNTKFGQNGYAYLVSSNGWLLAHPEIEIEAEHFNDYNFYEHEPVKRLLLGEEGIIDYEYGGQTWLAAYTPIKSTGWGIVVQQPKQDVFVNAKKDIRFFTVVSVAVFSLLALALGFVLDYALRPLSRLLGDIKSRELPEGKSYSRDEVGQLTLEFHSLFEDLSSSEKALIRANEELEDRVRERTEELERANEQLRLDIEERKEMQERIKTSLKEKEVLLMEVHHRVKNNLQVISSLLNMQTRDVDDEKTRELLMESQNRVRTMALIHEKLYQAEDLAKVNFSGYITSLIKYLFRSYSTDTSRVALHMDIPDVSMNIDYIISCALIVNELASNSLKYAFAGRDSGEIRIELRPDGDGRYVFLVSDNGIGLPEDLDIDKTKSLGIRLVKALVGQINGSMELKRDGGTAYSISFQEEDTGPLGKSAL
jgi:two-component sensor histidine kinase